MNRKIITSVLLVGAFLGLASCSRVLDIKPTDFLTPSNYFNSISDFETALVGIYDNLGSTNLYANRSIYLYGLEGDEGYYNGGAQIPGIRGVNFTASDADVNVFWQNLYVGISRSNVLLANIEKGANLDQSKLGVIKGEALFLRAYYYFLLVQTFGDVPLILTPIESPNDTYSPRTPARQVYEKIIEDMTAAESLVKDITDIGAGGQVNKSAVRGILARVCLHMAGNPIADKTKYEEASKWAKKVMDDTKANHKLNPSYSQVFINYGQDKYDIGESIWEVEFWGNTGTSYSESGYVGSLNGPRSTNPETGTGPGNIRATAKLYLLYPEGDLRKFWSIAHFNYDATGPSGAKTFVKVTAAASSIHNLSAGKYRREYELIVPKSPNVGPTNFPLLRFSDVLLMFAEAENEVNGPTAEAVAAVEQVRRRSWSTGIREVKITSGGAGYTSAPVVSFGGATGSINPAAKATVAGGKVTAITFEDDDISGFKTGSGYSSAPVVSFAGGGGTGATAVATINRKEDADVPAAEKSSKENFRLFIRDERARELCFETLRKHDLIRWGVYVQEMQAYANWLQTNYSTSVTIGQFKRVEQKHLLWPIPTYELSLNRALVQNPNW